ncbi:hypothetical protein E2493_19235 [Sphingomonas parva]|uniref:Uncharacterized protein n=1 Tax=Sphingomonas parva TaxID=2555898 RepID=A0A4Y8ZP61_9SPHN|nr:hypothetical protein [Sphingomonas parva]TFI56619.1 hypothetical protein E2493_19235 [Sphingomonas parva]
MPQSFPLLSKSRARSAGWLDSVSARSYFDRPLQGSDAVNIWEKARESWETGRQILDQLKDAKDHVDAAKSTGSAALDAIDRSRNLPLVLTAEQALAAMRVRYGARYPRKSVREMTTSEIEAAQWELVEAWKAFRRLSLITSAIQWALSRMIRGKPPVPGAIDLLNALEALFKATGDNPSRSEIIDFWAKYSSDQLDIAEQVARGLAETGKKYKGGSLSSPSRRKMLDDILADDGTTR